MSENIDSRDKNELQQAIVLAQHTVYKRYLQEIHTYPVMPRQTQVLDEKTEDCIRMLQLKELTCKQGEDLLQKLSTVYYASMSLGCNLVVMVDVERISAPAKIYIGVRNDGYGEEATDYLNTSFRTLKSGLAGNFPGTKITDISARTELPGLMDDIFGKQAIYVSSVSCIASARDKSKTENKSFIQGLERFIDAMKGNTYTALFIAEPITASEQREIRAGYENLYSTLSSFEKSIWSYNENESEAVMNSLSKGISKSVTEGTSHTQAHTRNVGVNAGMDTSRFQSHAEGTAKTRPTKAARLGQALSALEVVGSIASIITPEVGVVLRMLGAAMQGGSNSKSITDTIGKSLGFSGGGNAGYANTTADGTSRSETDTSSTENTQAKTTTKGSGKTLQIENINKPIEQMLKQIEEQLNRIRECEDYGAYSCGAYFLSGKSDSSLLAANTYRALLIGEGSSAESGAINFWDGNDQSEKVSEIKKYLKHFTHPVFALSVSGETETMEDFIFYTPGTTVSGLELPLHLGLPARSVYGLPVLEHAEFGRNVTYKKASEKADLKTVHMGLVFHMGQPEEKSSVDLDVSQLTAHTFITGSTGSGKSNAIYHLLKELEKENVSFLVVEPAKGEYKDVIGRWPDVAVLGTNPLIKDMELLHINPFRFPKHTHILEHLDRLVEIFNVCWPMYAAMPAILKDSVERAYVSCGWDLERSENKYDAELFPTFWDVVKQVREVLNESEYSADNKGDYIGSLVTRLRSLTNGINGLIFTSDDIKDEELFDKNVIVDLSRIGSSETKSLIMGLLVLKLQEYRMEQRSTGANLNDSLKHVTVLEEAHNLLKRTSKEQVSEGANLIGKSVEMLANSIAEMRTYGEGFVIADQSPGLLDMSVIRNTSTKIILNLPDLSDRELVGKAAGLTDHQIIELAKLEQGAAAMYQSSWLEPVLCKIDKYEEPNNLEMGNGNAPNPSRRKTKPDVSKSLLDCIMNKELYRVGDRVDMWELKNAVLKSNLETEVKCDFIRYITDGGEKELEMLRKLIYDFLKTGEAMAKAEKYGTISEWVHAVAERLSPAITEYSREQIDLAMMILLYEQSIRETSYDNVFCCFVEMYRNRGGVY